MLNTTLGYQTRSAKVFSLEIVGSSVWKSAAYPSIYVDPGGPERKQTTSGEGKRPFLIDREPRSKK